MPQRHTLETVGLGSENELEQRYHYYQTNQENNADGTAEELQHVHLTCANGLNPIDPGKLHPFPSFAAS
jgi:hypothetical protein